MISVIGGSGFVGSYLCKYFFENDICFEIIDLKRSNKFPKNSKIGDVRNIKSLKETISGDTVINLAAAHRDDLFDKKEYYETNVLGAANIIKVCEDRGIKKILFTSSVAVYGFASPKTSENGQINPFNEYGRTKFLAEDRFRDWQKRNSPKNSLTIIRPTVIFGPGNRGNVYNLFAQIASRKFIMIGSGTNFKSMAYIENVVSFIVYILKSKDKNILVNYVDTPDMDMNTLVGTVKEKLGFRGSLGFRIPYVIGLSIGILADIKGFIRKKKSKISSIRVKKFCSTSSFSTNRSYKDFDAPFSLIEGIEKTIEKEFISPDNEQEFFLTE